MNTTVGASKGRTRKFAPSKPPCYKTMYEVGRTGKEKMLLRPALRRIEKREDAAGKLGKVPLRQHPHVPRTTITANTDIYIYFPGKQTKCSKAMDISGPHAR